jgi:hypothetical protein
VGLDDLANKETGAIAAATAAAVSPRARELLRRGAVYGLAGVLRATDVALAAGRGAVRGARDGAASESTGKRGGTRSTARGGSRSTARGGSRQRKQPARRTRSRTA